MNLLTALYTRFVTIGLLSTETVVAEGSEDFTKSLVTLIIVSLAIGLFIGLLYAMSLKGSLTSVYSNETAADYKRSGSFKVEISKELFMYSKTEKKEKPQQNQEEKKE